MNTWPRETKVDLVMKFGREQFETWLNLSPAQREQAHRYDVAKQVLVLAEKLGLSHEDIVGSTHGLVQTVQVLMRLSVDMRRILMTRVDEISGDVLRQEKES